MKSLRALVVAVVAAAMTVSTAGVASARLHLVPASRDVRLVGHGYGHGIGMSQYGAEGAARQGKSWRQIVGFYYPRTTVGDASGTVRVLITGDRTNDVKVSPVAGLRIRDLGSGNTWELPRHANTNRWRINPNRWVQYHQGGSWKRWRQMKGNSEFYRAGNAPIDLWVPGSSGEVAKPYRGRLRSTHENTVNVLPLELYLRGVVPMEMPASWSREALKSQAVAARTYAVRLRSAHSKRYYQLCDTTSCQVYGGVSREHSRTNSAIKAVAKKVLRYDGSAALTMFSSSNGGWTADGGRPYLVAKKDSWDGWSGNPVHDWTRTLRAGTIEAAYPALGRLIGVNVVARSGHGHWGGRAERVVLDGTRGDVTLTGPDLRFRFGLRSHWFLARQTAIGRHWQRIGATSSRVGGTKGTEYRKSGGAAQVFGKGRIYWSKATGPHEVYGAILRRYLKLGGAGSVLGFPRTGEINGGVPRARLVKFQRGRIYWSKRTGAHEVYGAILRRYRRLGGTSSRLGLPVRGEYAVPGGRASDFEGGRIRWDRSTKKITVTYH